MAAVLQSQKTALITGAASGIGFAVAKLCRSRGMHLALLDVDATNLPKAKEALAKSGSSDASLKTETYTIDVGDKSQWDSVAARVKDTFPSLDLVLLNAARGTKPNDGGDPWVGNMEYWKQVRGQILYIHTYMTYGYACRLCRSASLTNGLVTLNKQIFDTNVFGPINGVSALLPLLKAGDKSPKSIVITGSKQGITNPPGGGNPAYNSTKGAIKILTEHLAHDLRSNEVTAHISAHLLVPGWTFTGMSGNVGPTDEKEVKKPNGAWAPSQVAQELESALERGSFYVICPDDDVDRALDQARMQWGTDDILEDRPALSRWEGEWKGKAEKAIQEDAKRRRAV
ncbi:hypothetical protein BDV06DRAFT_36306 [Aspergillus oleicola]